MFKRLKEKIKILAIPNKYKNIFENFINSLDIKPLINLRPVGKKSYFIMADLKNLLTESNFDKNLLDKLS